MSVHSRSLLFPRCPWKHHPLPPSQVKSLGETTPLHTITSQENRGRVQQFKSAARWVLFLGMRECVIQRGGGRRHEGTFQFVSLVLSSVCLSWRRVMSDSHAAWHCRGWRWMKTVDGGEKKWGERERGRHRDIREILSNDLQQARVNTVCIRFCCTFCSALDLFSLLPVVLRSQLSVSDCLRSLPLCFKVLVRCSDGVWEWKSSPHCHHSGALEFRIDLLIASVAQTVANVCNCVSGERGVSAKEHSCSTPDN